MSTVNEPAPSGKPRRTFAVFEAAPCRWVLTITTWPARSAAVDTHYHLTAVPSDFGGVAFQVAHLEVDGGEVYHVHLGGKPPLRDCCTCRGFVAHGHCKHVEALLALQAGGKLPTAPAPEPAPAPKPAPAAPAAPVVPWEDL